jgi:protein-disulfide isomerase
MRQVSLAITLVLTLAGAECGHPDGGGDDPRKPEVGAVPVAPRAVSDAPSAVRVPIDGLPVFGSKRALVTIVEFTDYDCPYCAKAERTMASLRAAYGDDLRVALAMRPLPMHERAAPSARALLAAAELGRAEQMHAQLFATQGAHDDDGLRAAAQLVGLDVRAFEAARASRSVAASLAKSEALANTVGAKGTPTFFINGRRITGAQRYEDFATLVDEEIIKAQRLVERGIARDEVYAVTMASAPAAVAPPPDPPAIDPVAVEVGVEDAPMRGDARAPVTVVVFSDFECPYCVKLESTLRDLEQSYAGKVRVAFRHHPLPMHAHARLAAKASLAADAQGKFWAYHDVLVAHRDALQRDALDGYARDVGLDVARFDRDLDDPNVEGRVAADEAQASALHVQGTPTTFVDGHRITGAQPASVFRTAIDAALAARR